MRCKNGFRQIPPKSGNCVKKNQTETIKKTLKNKTRKLKMEIPKFYFVADKIFKGYQGVIPSKYKDTKTMIQDYVDKKKFNAGDILFVGSDKSEKGFVIISNDGKALGNVIGGATLPIKYRGEIPKTISYKNMIEKMVTMYKHSDFDDKYEDWSLTHDFFDMPEGDEDDVIEEFYRIYHSNRLI